jgi:hypothetical protein
LTYFGQDFKVSIRACLLDSKFDNVPKVCITFVDSIIEIGECTISMQNKGIFLYFVATITSTNKIEDGVVDGSPS